MDLWTEVLSIDPRFLAASRASDNAKLINLSYYVFTEEALARAQSNLQNPSQGPQEDGGGTPYLHREY